MSRWEGKKGDETSKIDFPPAKSSCKTMVSEVMGSCSSCTYFLNCAFVREGFYRWEGGIWEVPGRKGFMFLQAEMLWIVCGFSGKSPLPKAAALQHQKHTIPLYSLLKNKNKWADWQTEHGRMDNIGMLRSSEVGGCSCDWDSKQSFQSTY